MLYFYVKENGKSLIFDYYNSLDIITQKKIIAYVLLLIEKDGNLGMPYTKHIKDKIWELRVDFNKNFHRIFYFIFDGEKIILLHGFNKKTNKTPKKEINQAMLNYNNCLNNLKFKKYEF